MQVYIWLKSKQEVNKNILNYCSYLTWYKVKYFSIIYKYNQVKKPFSFGV